MTARTILNYTPKWLHMKLMKLAKEKKMQVEDVVLYCLKGVNTQKVGIVGHVFFSSQKGVNTREEGGCGMKDKLKSSEVEKFKTFQPFNHSTIQPFNPSTFQPRGRGCGMSAESNMTHLIFGFTMFILGVYIGIYLGERRRREGGAA